MKPATFSITLLLSCTTALLHAQTPQATASKVDLEKVSFIDYDAFQKLTAEVKEHRKTRLLPLDSFLKASKEPNTVILDTRSEAMYKRKHLAGAIHLSFADFTQANLAKVIPSMETRILIYCNNNYTFDPVNFATKMAPPPPQKHAEKPLTLALNIPTYINLYGYGYKNVYELGELVSVFDQRLRFEGTNAQTKPVFSDSLPVVSLSELFGVGHTETMIGTDPYMDTQPFLQLAKGGNGMNAYVDYDAFQTLTAEVKTYRKDHLVNFNDFLAESKKENVIILDTRADSLYKRSHIKGAVHLEFSDFTVENLAKVIPSKDTKVLIYCNNNFYYDALYFDQSSYVTKAAMPKALTIPFTLNNSPKRASTKETPAPALTLAPEIWQQKPLTLALNIPTFINLYGYGYKNVYELGQTVSVYDPHLEFEGTMKQK